MYLIIILLFILVSGIFFYTWYKLHSGFREHTIGRVIEKNEESKFQEKYLKTSDGIKILSWYMSMPKAKAIIILAHGHKKKNSDKGNMLPYAKYLIKAGYRILLIDFRSFGKSGGDRTTLGFDEWKDIEAAYDYVKSLPENKGKKVGFLGKSMGGATAIITKGITGKGDFIISLTPYASFDSILKFRIVQRGYPVFPFLPFLHLATFMELGSNYKKYSPINLIKKINVPVLIVAAKHDTSVPKEDARYLYNNANNPKEFRQLPTNHENIFSDNPFRIQKITLNFLSKYI